MNEYFFGSGHGNVPARVAKQLDKIAHTYGADCICADIPRDGPRYWCSCENRGHPFDRDTAHDVLEEATAADLWPIGRNA